MMAYFTARPWTEQWFFAAIHLLFLLHLSLSVDLLSAWAILIYKTIYLMYAGYILLR